MQYATKDDIDKVTQHIDDLEIEIMSGLQTVYEEINETNRKYAFIRGAIGKITPVRLGNRIRDGEIKVSNWNKSAS